MPRYDFRCQKCGFEMEFSCEPGIYFQDILCPDCRKILQFKRLFPAPAVKFNGTGFYETDYKQKNAERTKPKAEKKKDNQEKMF